LGHTTHCVQITVVIPAVNTVLPRYTLPRHVSSPVHELQLLAVINDGRSTSHAAVAAALGRAVINVSTSSLIHLLSLPARTNADSYSYGGAQSIFHLFFSEDCLINSRTSRNVRWKIWSLPSLLNVKNAEALQTLYKHYDNSETIWERRQEYMRF